MIAAKLSREVFIEMLVYCGSPLERKLNWTPRRRISSAILSNGAGRWIKVDKGAVFTAERD
jgi:hypothetical protein